VRRTICLEKEGNAIAIKYKIQASPVVMSGTGIDWELQVSHWIHRQEKVNMNMIKYM